MQRWLPHLHPDGDRDSTKPYRYRALHSPPDYIPVWTPCSLILTGTIILRRYFDVVVAAVSPTLLLQLFVVEQYSHAVFHIYRLMPLLIGGRCWWFVTFIYSTICYSTLMIVWFDSFPTLRCPFRWWWRNLFPDPLWRDNSYGVVRFWFYSICWSCCCWFVPRCCCSCCYWRGLLLFPIRCLFIRCWSWHSHLFPVDYSAILHIDSFTGELHLLPVGMTCCCWWLTYVDTIYTPPRYLLLLRLIRYHSHWYLTQSHSPFVITTLLTLRWLVLLLLTDCWWWRYCCWLNCWCWTPLLLTSAYIVVVVGIVTMLFILLPCCCCYCWVPTDAHWHLFCYSFCVWWPIVVITILLLLSRCWCWLLLTLMTVFTDCYLLSARCYDFTSAVAVRYYVDCRTLLFYVVVGRLFVTTVFRVVYVYARYTRWILRLRSYGVVLVHSPPHVTAPPPLPTLLTFHGDLLHYVRLGGTTHYLLPFDAGLVLFTPPLHYPLRFTDVYTCHRVLRRIAVLFTVPTVLPHLHVYTAYTGPCTHPHRFTPAPVTTPTRRTRFTLHTTPRFTTWAVDPVPVYVRLRYVLVTLFDCYRRYDYTRSHCCYGRLISFAFGAVPDTVRWWTYVVRYRSRSVHTHWWRVCWNTPFSQYSFVLFPFDPLFRPIVVFPIPVIVIWFWHYDPPPPPGPVTSLIPCCYPIVNLTW